MAKEIEVKKDRTTPSGFLPDFERMAEDFFESRLPSLFDRWPSFNRRMVTNFREENDAYVLSADLPGMGREDIKVSVEGNILTIHAEHRKETTQNQGNEYHREYRSFHESFILPSNVKAAQVDAFCENGRLEVFMPKTEAGQQRQIEVKSSGSMSRDKH